MMTFDEPICLYGTTRLHLRILLQPKADVELSRTTVTFAIRQEVSIFVLALREGPIVVILLPKYAFVGAVFLAIGWWMAVGCHHRQQAFQQAALERLEKDLAKEREQRVVAQNQVVPRAPGAIDYKLLPDSLDSRDEDNATLVKVPLPQQSAIITCESMVATTCARPVIYPGIEIHLAWRASARRKYLHF
jgi:hypothetical protein